MSENVKENTDLNNEYGTKEFLYLLLIAGLVILLGLFVRFQVEEEIRDINNDPNTVIEELHLFKHNYTLEGNKARKYTFLNIIAREGTWRFKMYQSSDIHLGGDLYMINDTYLCNERYLSNKCLTAE